MGCPLYFFVSVRFLFSLFYLNLSKATHSSSSLRQLCHEDESSALLQLKQSLFINRYASRYSLAYPKVLSWSLDGENGNCCTWDGIECDHHTGHVIGLDISSSFLYGSINSNSTLFRLVHLQRVNLADNHFNYSRIPSAIRQLWRLTSLNLSASSFFGQIPSEILQLPELAFLDLSTNIDPRSSQRLLKLGKPSLSDLVQNLTNLQVLYLSHVNISSTVPETMANLTSLSALALRDCGLLGNFPSGVFSLPNLHTLSVRYNPNLTGYLPQFHRGSLLKGLRIAGTSFSGKLPESLGNLDQLNAFDIYNCSFSGPVPSSIGNLVELVTLDLSNNHFTGQIPTSLANLTQLDFLSLCHNNFSSGTLSWIGKQTKLTYLQLIMNNLYGSVPSSLANLTQLYHLDLSGNRLSGEIPSWFGNLTQLTKLYLHVNGFRGPIPKSIFKLTHLTELYLHYNNFSGTMDVEVFLKLRNLINLQLTNNKLSLVTTEIINGTIPKFKLLGLGSCNLSEFPKFLQYQDQMEWLVLSENNLRGHIPTWIWNVGKKTLVSLDLAGNFLTGFELPWVTLPWESLGLLDLRFNFLRGSIPIPPLSTSIYLISNNFLTGEIPSVICKLNSLYALDFSNNHLNGTIPECLSNFSDYLTILTLQNNKLRGTIPQSYNTGSNLKVIDFSQNHLDGPVPRTLANCKMLEILNLGDNWINDIFPFWLGTLPEMKILVLRYNKFHSEVHSPLSKFDFPKLRVIDMSWNSFSGQLPYKYLDIWSGMKVKEDVVKSEYAETRGKVHLGNYDWYDDYTHTMTITNKGAEIFYKKIQNVFKAIDLSGNKFEGEVPQSIGMLKGRQLLNLSHNALGGPIPTSLGNLTALESLDLSQNELSGDIPQQLVQLIFLEVFNVSHNHLTGPIPRGNQFSTFDNSSFEGNSGLCGDPLSKKCGNSVQLPSPSSSFVNDDEDEDFPSKLDLIIIGLGYLSGIVVGLVVGKILTSRYHLWFVRKFGKQPKWRRVKKTGRRN